MQLKYYEVVRDGEFGRKCSSKCESLPWLLVVYVLSMRLRIKTSRETYGINVEIQALSRFGVPVFLLPPDFLMTYFSLLLSFLLRRFCVTFMSWHAPVQVLSAMIFSVLLWGSMLYYAPKKASWIVSIPFMRISILLKVTGYHLPFEFWYFRNLVMSYTIFPTFLKDL